jgi:hypothetical protein
MNIDLLIIPECFVDTNLVETISPPVKGFNHQKGCGNVAKLMQTKLNNSFALGIIDRDKQEIQYLSEFESLANNNNLFLYKHPDKHHYIIQISPAIESFLLLSAKEVGLDLVDFHLPNTLNELKKITKKQNSKRDPNLSRFFKELKNRNSVQITLLSNWISYLKENNYNSRIEEIIEL